MNTIFRRPKAGFTLTELMAVVIIVGILAAVAAGSFKKAIERSHFSEGLTAANTVVGAVERYVAEVVEGGGDPFTIKSDGSTVIERPKMSDLDVSFANQRVCTGVSSEEAPYCVKTKYFEIRIREAGTVDAVRMKGSTQGDYTVRAFPVSFGGYNRVSDACIANTLPGGKDLCLSMGYTSCLPSNDSYCYKAPLLGR